MIEFRHKHPLGANMGRRWVQHPSKKKISDFAFGGFEYKINGRIFTHNSAEFREEFQKHLVWEKLND